MNKSTYNPKLDPKSTSYQPNAAKASVEVPVTAANAPKSGSDGATQQKNPDTKTGNQSPTAQAVHVELVPEAAAPQVAILKRDDGLSEQNRRDAKANYQGTPAVQGAASIDEKSSSAMISEGGHITSGTKLHVVREPSSMTDTLPASPEAQAAIAAKHSM